MNLSQHERQQSRERVESPLEIIYQDTYLVAINKPTGLLVHRTKLAADVHTSALQQLKKQLGQKVSPVHRIDRKTSGVLLFSFDTEAARRLQEDFASRQIHKQYLAIVRGYFPGNLTLNYPLVNDRNIQQDAETKFNTLKTAEIPLAFGKHSTSRYSLIQAYPKSGRMHQIRKHCKHLKHPIIGDRPHGCNKQNRLFKEQWNMTSMMLHAQIMELIHPISKKPLRIEAQLQSEFLRMQTVLGL